jgi:hypothetical protein
LVLGNGLRAAASFGATALGALLLLGDSTDDCETYAAYRGSFDYANGCSFGAPSGHVAFHWGEGRGDDQPQWDAAKAQLQEGGFAVSRAQVHHTGTCGGGEGQANPEDVSFQVGPDEGEPYTCGALHLHRTGAQQVVCTQHVDGGVSPAPSCTITFTPAP